ncbi:uncharacterized protein LAJ45_10480 [Morchella importuna]|uniref:Uncharacterized protein n=1 Tax=Morchella conica CCBAS932 TaxID=1392247 RepID=A0A3N4LGP4_9PEZI|nr:uncharacterized protein LAJ45_10480 [Morchella importuna]KAH8145510.1 hypothetical protein LAJ45_10480 [Morchella importuna]RPB17125.1 hypothetical protein P167DRAFT_569607 [Morchella conica CCBAS932]
MMRQPKPRKHGRNNSCQQAYGSCTNSFVVPLIPWPFPTPQSTPAPWVVEKDERPAVEEPKPIPVVRLSSDTTASSSKVEANKIETSKPSLSPELQAARERALASLKAARAIRSQSEEREKEKEREKEAALQELWKQSKSEFIEFSSRRRKQFKESVIENQKLQHKRARDMEWAAITRRVKRIETNIRKEREREERQREMEEKQREVEERKREMEERQREVERKRKIELAEEIWRKENEDVVDYVWEL